MKAVFIQQHGEPDVVKVGDVPEPVLGPDQVAIRVLCAGLNHLDIWVRKGRPGSKLPMPHVLGSDAVGVVAEVGKNVTAPAVGDEVIINPGLSCGHCEFCARGEQSVCSTFGIVGLTSSGTFAEKVVVPACNVYPKPPHLSQEEAAVLSLSCVTAYRMLMTRAQTRPGDSILIHGIGGGAALYALQLAKLAGAQVTVTSSSDDKLNRAAELGADHGINYGSEDVASRVKTLTDGRGVDVAIDSVGAATWPIDFAVVRKGGKVVICGVTTGAMAETNLQALYWNQLTLLGSTMGSAEDYRQMVRTVTTGQLRPVVDEVFPLERARDAMAKMEAGRQFGKIALRVSD